MRTRQPAGSVVVLLLLVLAISPGIYARLLTDLHGKSCIALVLSVP